MKSILVILVLLGGLLNAQNSFPSEPIIKEYAEQQPTNKQQCNDTLIENSSMSITVVGQGVAPSFASSPAQASALAKRAATADAYRLIAERIKGVRIEGKGTIKNMMVKSSIVNTQVRALVKNATVIETTFKEGLCEVEMEINLNYNDF